MLRCSVHHSCSGSRSCICVHAERQAVSCHTSCSPSAHTTLSACPMKLDIEKKLRSLLTKEKEKAEEQAALAMGLCATGGSMLP